MRHSHYGTLPGDFVGTGARLFARGIWLWLVLALLGVIAASLAIAVPPAAAGTTSAEVMGLIIGGVVFGMIMLALPLYPLFQAIVLRWRLEGVRFGPIALETTLRKRTIFGCYAKMLALSIVIGIGASMVAGVLMAFAVALFGSFDVADTRQQIMTFAVGAVFYIVYLTGFTVIKRVFLDRGLWVAAVSSTVVLGAEALDTVEARGEAVGSLGEGLADALDVGAI
jgi:hypothetical protein